MPEPWHPAVADITPHLRRWTEGGLDDDQTVALTAFALEAADDITAELGSTVPVKYEGVAKTAAVYLAAYRYLRSWHPQEDDLLLQRYRDDYEAALARLQRAVDSSGESGVHKTYGSLVMRGPSRRIAEDTFDIVI